jgi:hypothetical protein
MVCLFPHGTGVEQNKVRFGKVVRFRIILFAEDPRDPLRIVLIHLAAKGQDSKIPGSHKNSLLSLHSEILPFKKTKTIFNPCQDAVVSLQEQQF